MRWFEYFKALFRSKATVATTAIFSIAYYLLIEYVIGLNATNGYVFVTVPPVLIYLLAFTSGLLLTITIHSIRLSI
ncbi:MAG: hypothetical protein KGH71_06020, partial [Candidatus Micrarchaeota archaeon]|nr:hypothetical protein [Candidatus Micrarchaeota archaeon]